MGVTVLRVRNVATSVEWYREALGIEPVHVGADGPEHPIAAYHLAGLFFTLWQLPPGAEREDTADTTSYIAFTFDASSDLEVVRTDVARRGVTVDASVRSSANNRFFQFYDLDGNRWEFSQAVSASFRATSEELLHS